MGDIDPYRPDATVDERVDHVIGTLLHDEDAVRRYRTVQALQDGRLRDVAAISLRQLRNQHGTTEAAAAAVDISRQAANELLAKADAGAGARQDRLAREQPSYAYGAYLAVIDAIARALPRDDQRERAIMRTYDLVEKASQTLTMLPALAETAQRWLKATRVGGRPNWVEALNRRLDEHGPTVAAWAAERGDQQLTIQEQSEVWLGYHHARARWRMEAAKRAGQAKKDAGDE